jgi:hypothetical protein
MLRWSAAQPHDAKTTNRQKATKIGLSAGIMKTGISSLGLRPFGFHEQHHKTEHQLLTSVTEFSQFDDTACCGKSEFLLHKAGS